jgi:hypothetical protein
VAGLPEAEWIRCALMAEEHDRTHARRARWCCPLACDRQAGPWAEVEDPCRDAWDRAPPNGAPIARGDAPASAPAPVSKPGGRSGRGHIVSAGEYASCSECRTVLFSRPRTCPRCGCRLEDAAPAPAPAAAAVAQTVAPGVTRSADRSGTSRRAFLWCAAAGVMGVVARVVVHVSSGGGRLGGTPQSAGPLSGPQGRWDLTIGRSDWLAVDPKAAAIAVEGLTWDLVLSNREDDAAVALGWVTIPEENRDGAVNWERMGPVMEEFYRSKYPDFTARLAALVMRGIRRRSMELSVTLPDLGPRRGTWRSSSSARGCTA